MKKVHMVALSWDIKLFTVIEKAAMKGCSKIIWLTIQHTAPNYFEEGCCSKISDYFFYVMNYFV